MLSCATILLLTLANTVQSADEITDPRGTIVVFGDSISAAYGMNREQGWVNLLDQRLIQNDLNYRVINASVSGETTDGGLIRLPKTLEIHHPDLVILELGGNDGLRGYPIDRIRENLETMSQMIAQSGANILLIGMVLPPNYGHRYSRAFEALFDDVAERHGIELLPFLLEGVATPAELIQRDGIHPKPEAQPMLLDDIWPHVTAILSD